MLEHCLLNTELNKLDSVYIQQHDEVNFDSAHFPSEKALKSQAFTLKSAYRFKTDARFN